MIKVITIIILLSLAACWDGKASQHYEASDEIYKRELFEELSQRQHALCIRGRSAATLDKIDFECSRVDFKVASFGLEIVKTGQRNASAMCFKNQRNKLKQIDWEKSRAATCERWSKLANSDFPDAVLLPSRHL